MEIVSSHNIDFHEKKINKNKKRTSDFFPRIGFCTIGSKYVQIKCPRLFCWRCRCGCGCRCRCRFWCSLAWTRCFLGYRYCRRQGSFSALVKQGKNKYKQDYVKYEGRNDYHHSNTNGGGFSGRNLIKCIHCNNLHPIWNQDKSSACPPQSPIWKFILCV